MGFVWAVYETPKSWNEHYNELIKYKREFGHCIVPQEYEPNPLLGHWADTQRQKFNNQSISEGRVAKLNDLDLFGR